MTEQMTAERVMVAAIGDGMKERERKRDYYSVSLLVGVWIHQMILAIKSARCMKHHLEDGAL